MDGKDELLLAVKDARRDLEEGTNYRAADMLDVLEGIAPFLDRQALVKMKCSSCDNYAKASFSISNDLLIVDQHEYCHAKDLPISHLSIFKIAGCPNHKVDDSAELLRQVQSLVDEDLAPAFAERKLYDRNRFTSCNVVFRVTQDTGKVCVEFGHKSGEEFIGSDLKLYILRRLDPGFGADSARIAEAMKKDRPVIIVKASQQIRRLLDVDYVLEWIAEKRKMDIVYL